MVKSARSEPGVARFPIYREIVDFILYGLMPGAKSRLFAGGGGVVADIWFRFAENPDARMQVLVAPADDTNTYDLGKLLHRMLMESRERQGKASQGLPGVSPLDSYLAATIDFDDLISVLLPLTSWWAELGLDLLAKIQRIDKTKALSDAIDQNLSMKESALPAESKAGAKINEAMPAIILTGMFFAIRKGALKAFPERPEPNAPLAPREIAGWLNDTAVKKAIAEHARAAFDEPLSGMLESHVAWRITNPGARRAASGLPPNPIQRIFLDRTADLAVLDAKATIKADAAQTLFNVDCSKIAWAVIDSGVDVRHPAFRQRNADGKPDGTAHRIRGVYDFTEIDKIVTFDLLESGGMEAAVASFTRLSQGTGKGKELTPSKKEVEGILKLIAESLNRQLKPDWSLVEKLVELKPDTAPTPESNHGTHVAGIIGADWEEEDIVGACPDIALYDFRVTPRASQAEAAKGGGRSIAKITEFSLIAALEFIQYLNTRQAQAGLQIHGVNISLSIPHDVRNYGCGSTPVCVACDKLVGSGVVVVAAAGNFGWQEREGGFSQFLSSSITDPGNSREVITVGSTHKSKPHTYGVSYFSGRGPTGDGRMKPDVVAPGEKIKAPIPDGQFDELTGTSMAAPMVSGAAAILLARYRELIGNPRRIKDILCRSATDLERERHFQGHGLVDVLRALQSV